MPQNVIEKKSSPHLWKEHEAEKELGISYGAIDSILYCIFDKKLSVEKTIETLQIEKQIVEKVYQLHLNSIHKRETHQKPFEDL